MQEPRPNSMPPIHTFQFGQGLSSRKFKKWRSRFDILKQVVRKQNPQELQIVKSKFHLSQLRKQPFSFEEPIATYIATENDQEPVVEERVPDRGMSSDTVLMEGKNGQNTEQPNSDDQSEQMKQEGSPTPVEQTRTPLDAVSDQMPLVQVIAGESCLGYIYPKIVEIEGGTAHGMFKASHLDPNAKIEREQVQNEIAAKRRSLPQVSKLKHLIKNVTNQKAQKQPGKFEKLGTAAYGGILYPESYFEIALNEQKKELDAASIHSPSSRSKVGRGNKSPTALSGQDIGSQRSTTGMAQLTQMRDELKSQQIRGSIHEQEPLKQARQATPSVLVMQQDLETSLDKWADYAEEEVTPTLVKKTRVGGATFVNTLLESHSEEQSHKEVTAEHENSETKDYKEKKAKTMKRVSKSLAAVKRKNKKSIIQSLRTQPLQLQNLTVFMENLERTGNPLQASEAAANALKQKRDRSIFKSGALRSQSQTRCNNSSAPKLGAIGFRGTYGSLGNAYTSTETGDLKFRATNQSQAHMTFGTGGALSNMRASALPSMYDTQVILGTNKNFNRQDQGKSLEDSLLKVTTFAKSQEKLYLVGNHDVHEDPGPQKKAGPFMKTKQQHISDVNLTNGQMHATHDSRVAYEPFEGDNDQVFTVEDSHSRSSNWPRAVGSSNQSLLMNASKPFVASFNQNGKRSNKSPEVTQDGVRDDINRHYISIPYPRLAQKSNLSSNLLSQRRQKGHLIENSTLQRTLQNNENSTLLSFNNNAANADLPPNFIGKSKEDPSFKSRDGIKSRASNCLNSKEESAGHAQSDRREKQNQNTEWKVLNSSEQFLFEYKNQPLHNSYEQAAVTAMTEMAARRLRNQEAKTRSGKQTPGRLAQVTETADPSPSLHSGKDMMMHSQRAKNLASKMRANAVSHNSSMERGNSQQKVNHALITDEDMTSQYTALNNVSGYKYQPSPQVAGGGSKADRQQSSGIYSDEESMAKMSPRQLASSSYGYNHKKILQPRVDQHARYMKQSDFQRLNHRINSIPPPNHPNQVYGSDSNQHPERQERDTQKVYTASDDNLAPSNQPGQLGDQFEGSFLEGQTVFGDGVSNLDQKSREPLGTPLGVRAMPQEENKQRYDPLQESTLNKTNEILMPGLSYNENQATEMLSSTMPIQSKVETNPLQTELTDLEFSILKNAASNQSLDSNVPFNISKEPGVTNESKQSALPVLPVNQVSTSIQIKAIQKQSPPNDDIARLYPGSDDSKPVSFRQTDMTNTNTYLLKKQPKQERKTMKPQVTNLVIGPFQGDQNQNQAQGGHQMKTKTLAQKKTSLSVPKHGVNSGVNAASSQLNLTMPPLDNLLNSWKQNSGQPIGTQPTAQTHKFLPNLRLKKNSVVHNQKGIQKIRQGHQRSKKEPEHGRVSSLESEGGGTSPIVVGLPSMQTEHEVGSKYLESGRFKLDSQTPDHTVTTMMGETFNIKKLLNVQQMAIKNGNQSDNSQNRSSSPQIKENSIEAKNSKKQGLNRPCQSRQQDRSRAPFTQSTAIVESKDKKLVESPQFANSRHQFLISSLEFEQQDTELINKELPNPGPVGTASTSIIDNQLTDYASPPKLVMKAQIVEKSRDRQDKGLKNNKGKATNVSADMSESGHTITSDKKRQVVVHKRTLRQSLDSQLGQQQTKETNNSPKRSNQSNPRSRDDKFRQSHEFRQSNISSTSNQDYLAMQPIGEKQVTNNTRAVHEIAKVSIPLPPDKQVKATHKQIGGQMRHRKKLQTPSRTGQGFYPVKNQIDPIEADRFINSGDVNSSNDICFVQSQRQESDNYGVRYHASKTGYPSVHKSGQKTPVQSKKQNNASDSVDSFKVQGHSSQLKQVGFKKSSQSSNKAQHAVSVPVNIIEYTVPGRTSLDFINQAQENNGGAGLTGDRISQTSTQRAVTPLSIIPSQQTVNNRSNQNQINQAPILLLSEQVSEQPGSRGVVLKPFDDDVGQTNEIVSNQSTLVQGRDLRNAKADYAQSQERPVAMKRAKAKQRSQSHVSQEGGFSSNQEFCDQVVLKPRQEEIQEENNTK